MFSLAFFICTLLSVPVSQAQPVDPVKQFVNQHIKPLLLGREDLYSIYIKQAEKPVITLYSGSASMWMGRYQITLNPDVNELPSGAPKLTSEWAQYQGVPLQRLKGEIELPLKGPDPAAKLRSLLRADALLHPMIAPPGKQATLAPIQREIVSQLRSFHNQAATRKEGTRALMLAATGFGKTVMSALFLEELIRDKQPYKIVFVVQNNEILNDATIKFQNLLGINPHDVRRFYGEGDTGKAFANGSKLIAMSRTKMFRNLASLMEERKEFKGRVFYVFDEAHHLGKLDGEFNEILEAVDKDLRPGDVLLGTTATPWHTDSDIIERIFRNHVATALITPEEKQKFIENRQLIYLARLMLFRAIAEGYLSPIQSYKQVRYLESDSVPVLARAFLDDWDLKFEGLELAERYALIKKEIKVHVPFIKTVIREILGTIEHDQSSKPLYMNRGIIFVPSIAHADVYAFLLNTYSPPGKNKILAKAYHSGMKQEIRDATMDWFRDQEKKEEKLKRVNRIEVKDNTHKYLVVIRTLGEGFDEPRVNHIVLAKPYSAEDQVGMRELLQNLGRASRLSYAKKDFQISDFTGDMRRLIFEGLDQSLVKSFFLDGTENQLDDAPTPLPDVIQLPDQSMTRVTDVVLDSTTFKVKNFKTEEVAVPGLDLSDAKSEMKLAPPEVDNRRFTVEEDEINKESRYRDELPDSKKRMSWKQLYAQPGSAYFIFRNDEQEFGARMNVLANGISLNDVGEFIAGTSAKENPFDAKEMAILKERDPLSLHERPLYKGFDPTGRLSPIMPIHFGVLYKKHKLPFTIEGYKSETPYLYGEYSFERWLEEWSARFSNTPLPTYEKNEKRKIHKTLEQRRIEDYFIKNLGKEVPALYRRLPWNEFFARPGSAVFIFHPSEHAQALRAAKARLSINDLRRMCQHAHAGVSVFSDWELAGIAERLFTSRLFLDNGSFQFEGFDEEISPFMPAHFMYLPIEAFSTSSNAVGGRLIDIDVPNPEAVRITIPEYTSGDGLQILFRRLRINSAQYADRYSAHLDESDFSATFDHDDKKILFRPLKWRDFVHRPGSSYFLFKATELENINRAAQDQLSVYDIYQMVKGEWIGEIPFADDVLAILKPRVLNSRLPNFDDNRAMAQLSYFTPAHFLFLPLNFIGESKYSYRPMIDAINEEVLKAGNTRNTSWLVADRLIPELPTDISASTGNRYESYDESQWSKFLGELRRSRVRWSLRNTSLFTDQKTIPSTNAVDQDFGKRWTWARVLVHPVGVQMLARQKPRLRSQMERLAEMRESLLSMVTGDMDYPPELTRPQHGYHDRINHAILRRRVDEALDEMGKNFFAADYSPLKKLIFENSNLLSREVTPHEATETLRKIDEQERRLIELRPDLADLSPFTMADFLQKPMLWEGYIDAKQDEQPQYDHRMSFGRRTVLEAYLATRGIRMRNRYARRHLEVQFAILGLPSMLTQESIKKLEEGSCEEKLTAKGPTAE